eukprot:207159-Pleurochrysis_carterae.AAC.1
MPYTDGLKYVVPAVHGFNRSIALGRERALQDTLRLLTLWFKYGAVAQVQEAVQVRARHVAETSDASNPCAGNKVDVGYRCIFYLWWGESCVVALFFCCVDGVSRSSLQPALMLDGISRRFVSSGWHRDDRNRRVAA